MKKSVLLLLLILVSCNENKTYKVVDIVDEEALNGEIIRKEIVNIEECKNDSIASIMAYNNFCLGQKLDKDYEEKNIKDYTKIIDFKLLNEQNKTITTDKYLTNDIKNKIFKEIFKSKNIFEQTKIVASKEEIESQFSSYDGHHIKLEKYVLSRMNNPDSYKHISSEYKVKNGFLDVIITFRGANSYNAIVINRVQAKCDLSSGDIIEIINEQ